MKRLSKLAGLPVVLQATGKRVARVERACLSDDGQQLSGVVVQLFGFGRRRRFVEFGNILLFGQVSLQVLSLCRVPPAHREAAGNRRVYDTSGELLGWMTDGLLDENDGRIRALELSYGYLDDLSLGRVWVRDFASQACGFIAARPPEPAGNANQT